VYNDAAQSFEPVVRVDPNGLPYPDFGHAFRVTAEGREYCYFALPFPLTVRLRVEAKWDNVIDPNRYEVLTALGPDDARQKSQDGERKAPDRRPEASGADRLEPAASDTYRWTRFDALAGGDPAARARVIAALQREKKGVRFHDVASGREITPHGGSVYFNPWRGKWIAIFLQVGGTRSYLGEVWYAEADTPVGPWAYAHQVVTHNKYSFYNPKQHPYFDQDGGRTIFFEGTYSHTFSGSPEAATPRYDYNQIMYRLSLDDPGLTLPAPVCVLRAGRAGAESDEKPTADRDRDISLSSKGLFSPSRLLPGQAVARANQWDSVESVAFYAVEPDRAAAGLVPVYGRQTPHGQAGRLTTEPGPSARPLFLARPAGVGSSDNSCLRPLYEYRHAGTGRYYYSFDPQLAEAGWERAEKPLCRLWRAPAGPLLLDRQVRRAGSE